MQFTRRLAALTLAALLLPAQAAPALDTALVGVWENTADDLELVFLPDGRVFSLNTMPGSAVEAETGTYQVKNGQLVYQWLISGLERTSYGVDGDQLTLGGWLNLSRTGHMNEAASEYARRSQELADITRKWLSRYPVAQARPGAVKDDPHPERAPREAAVYGGAGLDFEDLTLLDRSYIDPDNPNLVHTYKTFQASEIFLYPNGRFWHTTVLPKGVDARLQPTYTQTTVWGSYSVKPQGALEGDTVTLKYDGGDSGTVKVLGGRRYLKTTDVLYLNQKPKPRPRDELQFR
ncbi:hypothetical protein DKM44_00670 [Deinococcus irradiatisoli]|uniref:Uncharacterized protein n=1 Tax=Deinococcus irradiatisoli TaxID=2202254 RepID=A0A2Z3JEN0_9DEIO|nr:hypothetical protein [Deinococcus irradiatisoli]AWN21931.1 hypothetical protein DKM44_00670 [Deinococcus irradiatisoli]